MMVPNGKDEEENNSKVSFDVTGQVYTSKCGLILYWAQFGSLSSPKMKSKLQKQEVGEDIPFPKKSL